MNENEDGLRLYCKNCKEIFYIRMVEGRFDNRLYSEVFKKDLCQPGENLYYKSRQELLSII